MISYNYKIKDGEERPAKRKTMKTFKEELQELRTTTGNGLDERIKRAILNDNAARAFVAEYLGAACEVWNKYEGKRIGEKTKKKIANEIKQTCGVWFSYDTRHYGDSFVFYMANGGGVSLLPYFRELEIFLNGKLFDKDGKAQRITADGAKPCNVGEYVEDVEAHKNELLKAFYALEEAEKKTTEARNAYNALTRGNIEKKSPFEYFSARIF